MRVVGAVVLVVLLAAAGFAGVPAARRMPHCRFSFAEAPKPIFVPTVTSEICVPVSVVGDGGPSYKLLKGTITLQMAGQADIVGRFNVGWPTGSARGGGTARLKPRVVGAARVLIRLEPDPRFCEGNTLIHQFDVQILARLPAR